MNKERILTLLLTALVILQVLDSYTTHTLIISKQGVELNPLMAYLMNTIGVIGALAVKMAIAVSATIYLLMNKASKGMIIALSAITFLYTLIIINNLYLMSL